MKCNEESHRSLFLQYPLAYLAEPEATAITLRSLIRGTGHSHPTQRPHIDVTLAARVEETSAREKATPGHSPDDQPMVHAKPRVKIGRPIAFQDAALL
jgi:hypothetical protein